ncbi:uncharacterized protein SCODWIG_01220 [Saccharomycodes ludwigii]|uniref:UBR-type domain-containing protein n=1 Tax=Saccharomycodes ludwigii TaxID=36035 RepID=A0A376B4F2_9ASCO|nr:uncharacterized protein SCODWIG_01220 [Saccharomycodes ludwigii]
MIDPNKQKRNQMCDNKGYTTAVEFLDKQEKLEKEARRLMPYDPVKCTYAMGSLKQLVFACLTCNNIGVCYSCSIQCHSTHEIVELFSKRDFTCDCGTERDGNGKHNGVYCQIRKNTELDIPSYTNVYGHNYTAGEFCSCNSKYDPNTESGDMIQCVLGLECNEDWYHDYCILGLPKPDILKKETKEGETKEGVKKEDEKNSNGSVKFPDLDTFDTFICWKCINKYRSNFEQLLDINDSFVSYKINRNATINNLVCSENKKRKIEIHDYSLFLKKGYGEILQKLVSEIEATGKYKNSLKFLTEICSCLLKDVPIYKPSEDKEEEYYDMFSLGNRELNNHISRDTAITGILALEEVKTKLKQFLRPFAETGKVVEENDIKSFFAKQASLGRHTK